MIKDPIIKSKRVGVQFLLTPKIDCYLNLMIKSIVIKDSKADANSILKKKKNLFLMILTSVD